MSNPTIDQIRSAKAPSVTELVAETRIDPSHLPSTAARDAEPSLIRDFDDGGIDLESWADEEPLPADAELISRQVQTQASQLAEHLRKRQEELDHREAELNARSAKVESEMRAARLWLAEREAEFEEAEETAMPLESVVLQEEAIRRKAESLAAREQALIQAESHIESQQSAMQRLHEQLIADRRILDDESQAQSERMAAEQFRQAADLNAKRREVRDRAEQVDRTRAALEQFRGELSRMQRETLETRLATEELWAELTATAPSAALTRSLGRSRRRLTDHYRMANQELQQKKEELERLRGQLSEQYEKLVRQKRNFDAWAAECRDEVEQQSARLLAQGRELDQRDADMCEFSRRWQAERLDLQQEIRRLRLRLTTKAEAELRA